MKPVDAALLSAIGVLSLASGCEAWVRQPVQFVPATTHAEPAPPTSPASIEVLFLTRPSRQYRPLGTFTTLDRDMAHLRAEAAAHGCEALILTMPVRRRERANREVCYDAPLEAVCVRWTS